MAISRAHGKLVGYSKALLCTQDFEVGTAFPTKINTWTNRCAIPVNKDIYNKMLIWVSKRNLPVF